MSLRCRRWCRTPVLVHPGLCSQELERDDCTLESRGNWFSSAGMIDVMSCRLNRSKSQEHLLSASDNPTTWGWSLSDKFDVDEPSTTTCYSKVRPYGNLSTRCTGQESNGVKVERNQTSRCKCTSTPVLPHRRALYSHPKSISLLTSRVRKNQDQLMQDLGFTVDWTIWIVVPSSFGPSTGPLSTTFLASSSTRNSRIRSCFQ